MLGLFSVLCRHGYRAGISAVEVHMDVTDEHEGENRCRGGYEHGRFVSISPRTFLLVIPLRP